MIIKDYHPDHLNTGKLVYYALYKLNDFKFPKKVFYYYTTKSNFYIKCKWKDFKIIKKALDQHKSQISPLESKFTIFFYKKFSILKHLIEKGIVSESFRVQKLQNGIPIPPKKFNQMGFKKRLAYYIFSAFTISGYKKFHNLTLEDLRKLNQL
ncbi:MAG: hypothetical protein ACTSPY_04515 [Candidatus Helarchaeota archaeon]